MSFQEEINASLVSAPVHHALAQEFLDPACKTPRYVVGRNDESAAVLGLVDVAGIIDDFAKELVAWKDIPVVRLADVPPDAMVLNCSTSISPVSVTNNLAKAGIRKLLNYCDLVSVAGNALHWPLFVRQQRDDWTGNEAEWTKLHDGLADEDSRRTLLDVLRYRLTADPKFMRSYAVRLHEQYFEDFMAYKNEVFVDAGGFDGDTSEAFCKRYPDYQRIYLFEPSKSNIAAARKRLGERERIEFLQLGLSDVPGILHFNSNAGSASSVSEAGDEEIEVVRLDDVVHQPVSFIKMDLEGWEMQALAGCEQHILSDHPKLAISVYHAAEDFRRVPAYILSLLPHYRIYLRHYTEGWSETVMYFVPV